MQIAAKKRSRPTNLATGVERMVIPKEATKALVFRPDDPLFIQLFPTVRLSDGRSVSQSVSVTSLRESAREGIVELPTRPVTAISQDVLTSLTDDSVIVVFSPGKESKKQSGHRESAQPGPRVDSGTSHLPPFDFHPDAVRQVGEDVFLVDLTRSDPEGKSRWPAAAHQT